MKYQLEVKEPYIIKTEMLKNRTHQTFRWKAIALSNNKNLLKPYLTKNHRIINRTNGEEEE